MEFSRAEEQFLQDNEVVRFVTIDPSGLPHAVSAYYICSSLAFWVATDYRTRKHRNLQKNENVASLVDVGQYSSRGILIQGTARILEKGPEFHGIYAVFHKEGEAPFIRIEPSWKVSWGLDGVIAVLGANRKLFWQSLCTRIYMPKLFSGYA